MSALLLVLLAAAATNAAVDFSKLSSISTTATFHLHVEVDQLYFGKKTNASVANTVAMIFNSFAVELPIKDNINDFEASEVNRTRPYFFHSSSCLRTQWTATGVTTLPTPHVMINEDDTTIYQYIDYADAIMYSDFERPWFVFGVQAFEQSSASPSTRADCNFVPPYDARNSSDVINAQLCYTQNSSCNVWIGDFGWVYFGSGIPGTNSTVTHPPANYANTVLPDRNQNPRARMHATTQSNKQLFETLPHLADATTRAQQLLTTDRLLVLSAQATPDILNDNILPKVCIFPDLSGFDSCTH